MSTFNELIDFTRSTTGTYLDSVVYGPELVTNGDFVTDSDWIKDSGWTISNGQAQCDGTDGAQFRTIDSPLTNGKTYYISYQITAYTSGDIRVLGQSFYGISSNSVSTVTGIFVATKPYLRFYSSAFNGSIDNVSVKEVIGGQVSGTPLLRTAAINEPRLEYDASGNPLGLLIEEARTNLVLNSVEASSDNAATNITQIANKANSLTGTDDAFLLQANTTGVSYTGQLTSVTSGTSYTASRFAKAGASNFAQLSMGNGGFGSEVFANFDLSTGTISQESNCAAVMTSFGGGWYRCSISKQAVTTTSGTSPNYFSAVNSGTASARTSEAGNSVYFYGNQVETGSFPTSYIPTSGSAVTRAADVASVTAFKYHQNNSQATLLVETALNASAAEYRRVAELGYSNLNFSIQAQAGRIKCYSRNAANSATVGVLPIYVYEPLQSLKVALAVKSGSAAQSVNGVNPVTETDVYGLFEDNVPLLLGRGSYLAYLNGHIKSIQYYPKRLSNEELELLTQPSASPTMNLTFDGQATSTLVEGLHD
jgi:hypothetical protein